MSDGRSGLLQLRSEVRGGRETRGQKSKMVCGHKKARREAFVNFKIHEQTKWPTFMSATLLRPALNKLRAGRPRG